MTKNRTTDKGYISPDREECLRVLEEYGTPKHVIEHCKAVAAVAYALGISFNERDPSYEMDPDLILAAGLLHDMARTEESHWDVAAEACRSRGWDREAEIISLHMHYDPFNSLEDLNETDLVCLADRIVMEDRYVGLRKRMEYIMEKARKKGHPEHIPHIRRRMGDVEKLIGEMEDYLGCSLDSIMEDLDYECPEGKE